MDRLDIKYLTNLVMKAQTGDSNAFAELYTATYQSEFAYAYRFLQDYDVAKKALMDTYGRALKEINKLTEPDMIMAWLYRLNFQICYEAATILAHGQMDDIINVDGVKYRLVQLTKNLPMTEAQVLIMYYYQHYSIREINQMLGGGKGAIKWHLKQGKNHLKRLMQE